jgi:hypothetical protein
MEGRVSEQLLSERAEPGILFQEREVLSLELLGLVGPGRDFAFKLANVFWVELATGSTNTRTSKDEDAYPFFEIGKHGRRPYF